MPKYLTLNIAGHDFPVLETTVKPKPGKALDPSKTYFTFREPTRASGAFGVQLPALETNLPTQVVLDGVTISLLPGKTAAEYRDRTTNKTVVVPEDERRDLTAFNGLQTFPSLQVNGDTGIRTTQVTISKTKDGLWNVKIVVRKATSSASPEERHESAAKRAEDALATFGAIFAALQVPEAAKA